jgi:class 3 adenylate cyclase
MLWDIYRNTCYLLCFTLGELVVVVSVEYRERFDFNIARECHLQKLLLQEEEANHLALLHQLLPKHIAARLLVMRNRLSLTHRQKYLAESFECVTIVRTDIVGFTAFSSAMTPLQLRFFLNSLYQRFDDVIARQGLYKVEIIGDAMVVVGGCPGEGDASGEGGAGVHDVHTAHNSHAPKGANPFAGAYAVSCCRAATELFDCLSEALGELSMLLGQRAQASTFDGYREWEMDAGGYADQSIEQPDVLEQAAAAIAIGGSDDDEWKHKSRLTLASTLNVTMRIAIHSGPVVAGVIGSKDLRYHVFGPSLRIAERLEGGGVPGRIVCSESTFSVLRGHPEAVDFEFNKHGVVDLGLLGRFQTYFVDPANGCQYPRESGKRSGSFLERNNGKTLSKMRLLMNLRGRVSEQRPHSSPANMPRHLPSHCEGTGPVFPSAFAAPDGRKGSFASSQSSISGS